MELVDKLIFLVLATLVSGKCPSKPWVAPCAPEGCPSLSDLHTHPAKIYPSPQAPCLDKPHDTDEGRDKLR